MITLGEALKAVKAKIGNDKIASIRKWNGDYYIDISVKDLDPIDQMCKPSNFKVNGVTGAVSNYSVGMIGLENWKRFMASSNLAR